MRHAMTLLSEYCRRTTPRRKTLHQQSTRMSVRETQSRDLNYSGLKINMLKSCDLNISAVTQTRGAGRQIAVCATWGSSFLRSGSPLGRARHSQVARTQCVRYV